MSTFSRRGFLKGIAAATGAAVGTRIGGRFVGDAFAAGEPAAVVILHLVGGYNSIFASADSLVGKFGVTAGNHTVLGGTGGLAVDNTFANSMSNFAKTHMAAIGVRHGITAHPTARSSLWRSGTDNAGLVLAGAIGGTAAIKAAILGVNTIPDANFTGAVSGVSFQPINDMASTIAALGGGAPDPRKPDRAIALAAMTGSQSMSANRIGASPLSLSSVKEGYSTAIEALKQAPPVFDYNAIATAYGQPVAQTAVTSFRSKLVAAELMVKAGANVVVLSDTGWDTHDDVDGTTVRNKMTSYVLAPLNTFISRIVADTTRNVTLCIMGDFARSLPGSDHQPNLTATVIGRNVKLGTTGRTIPGTVGLPTGTPSIPGLWAYLAAVAKVPGAPFGANPHNLVL